MLLVAKRVTEMTPIPKLAVGSQQCFDDLRVLKSDASKNTEALLRGMVFPFLGQSDLLGPWIHLSWALPSPLVQPSLGEGFLLTHQAAK